MANSGPRRQAAAQPRLRTNDKTIRKRQQAPQSDNIQYDWKSILYPSSTPPKSEEAAQTQQSSARTIITLKPTEEMNDINHTPSDIQEQCALSDPALRDVNQLFERGDIEQIEVHQVVKTSSFTNIWFNPEQGVPVRYGNSGVAGWLVSLFGAVAVYYSYVSPFSITKSTAA